jgi:hypothetical protein
MSSVQDFEAGGAIEVRSGQGFFYALRFELGGEWINLYDLENTIIRGYGDARIHAAINCASKGCPTLANFAFLPGKMDAQFDAVMETMVAEKRNLEIDHEGKVVRASSIFDWFRSDFEGEGGLMAYWSRFASEEKAAELARARDEDYQIEFVPYDWGIIAVSMN